MLKYNRGSEPKSVIPDVRADVAAERGAYKWYVLALLVLIYLMASVDRAVISVVVEPLKTEFLLSDKEIGLLALAFSLAYGLAVLPMGWLVDRVDRRALLSVTLTIWAVLTAIGALSSSFITLIASRMGVGAAEAPSTPASLSLIADTFPMKQRNTAVSIYIAGAAAGQIVVFIIGGWLLMHFSWRAVFLVAGGPGLVLAALLYFTTREPQRGVFDGGGGAGSEAVVSASYPSMKEVFRSIRGNAALCYAIPATTLASGVGYSVTVWMTSFLVRIHGLTVSQGAIWTGIGFGLSMMVGTLIIGPLADRFSNGDQRKLTLIPITTTAIAVIAGAVMTLSSMLLVSLVGLFVLALMAGFFLATGYSLVLSLSAPKERGTTMAMTRLVSMLIGTGGIPLLTGLISDAIGGLGSIRVALLSNMGLLLISTFCYVMIYKLLGKRNKIIAAAALM